MKRKHLKIASFSDVHVFHPKTPTAHILQRLTLAFPDNQETGKLDIIFIPGDFFDRIQQLSAIVVTDVITWITKFYAMCSKRDIVIRIMEGTPSHDRGQPILFTLLAEASAYDIDVKYVDVLHIEHLERFGIDILYIPDEWRADPADTWSDVKELLASKGLTKVDYALMHGFFEYQVPPAVKFSFHDIDKYSSIVRKYILNGHIHQRSRMGKVVVAGSFDRNCHGDEHEKGHWRITEGEHADSLVFMVNHGAVVYRSVPVHGLTINEILTKVDEDELGYLPMGSNIRLVLNKGDDGVNLIDELNGQHDNLTFTLKVINDDVTMLADKEVLALMQTSLVEINERNLVESVLEQMEDSGSKLTVSKRKSVEKLLTSIL